MSAREVFPLSTEDLSSFPSSPAGGMAESAFHGPAGELVRLIEPHSEADPGALLTNALAALGNLIGAGPHMRVEGDQHPARIFVVHVGESSKSRKGSAWGQIRSILELIDDRWATERIASGLSSGEGLIYHVRDASGDEDPIDRRLLVIEPEFASVLRRMEREGNTLSSIMREAWDTGRLRTLTKKDAVKATGAHVSVIGHVTRPELLRYLTRTEAANGFGNRFLWIPVRRSKALPRGGAMHRENIAPTVDRLRRAVSKARRIIRVDWSDEAGEAWDLVYEELSEGKPGMIGDMTSRAEAQVLRLAILYAILDGSALIEYPHLAAAYAIWDYAAKGVCRIFADRTGDPLADQILDLIRSSGSITRTGIQGATGRNYAAARLDDAITLLVTLNLAGVEEIATNGRPATVYVPR